MTSPTEKHISAAIQILDERFIALLGVDRLGACVQIIAAALAKAECEGMEPAYLAGFAVSGEGYNGEYPFDDSGLNPLADPSWCETRDKFLAAISETGAA